MPKNLASEVVRGLALLDEIHRHPPARTGRLKFRSMAEVPDAEKTPSNTRDRLKRELRTLGQEIHSRGGSLHQVASAAIRDERDASVLAAAWDRIGRFYQ